MEYAATVDDEARDRVYDGGRRSAMRVRSARRWQRHVDCERGEIEGEGEGKRVVDGKRGERGERWWQRHVDCERSEIGGEGERKKLVDGERGNDDGRDALTMTGEIEGEDEGKRRVDDKRGGDYGRDG